MRILFLVFLALVLLCACAPAPVPSLAAPTSAPPQTLIAVPLPTRTQPPSGPTRSPIAVVDVRQSRDVNGNIKTTASVTTQDNLGLGQMEVASPETMLMGEARTISLRVSPAQQLASSTPVASPGKTPDLPKFVYKFGGNIELYPIMIAELRTLSFDVDQKGPIRREVSPNVPATWNWIVSPRSPGRQDLAIEISIPAVINGVDSELSTLQDLPIEIVVQMPTPTPVPLADRLGESVASNSGAIIVALIGLIGTLVGVLVKVRSDQGKAARKRSKR